jgi:acyl dehydratase
MHRCRAECWGTVEAMPRYLEDLIPGLQIPVGRYRLERGEMIEFARRWDPQPFHVDEEVARRSIFHALTASSLHLFAICTRLFFDLSDPIAVLAMLGKDEVRFPHPARAGDELDYRTTCAEARHSRSHADRGVVVLSDTLARVSGEPVLTQRVSLLVARRPSAAFQGQETSS